jgi:outer membrane protein insertion porin family
MKRCLIIMAVIAFVSADAHGQRPSRVANQTPVGCNDVNPPGRPTLKRRQPSSVSTAAGSSVQKVCTTVREKNDQDRPVKIEFEGLHGVSEKDLFQALGESGAAFPSDALPDGETINKATKIIWETLQAHGYMHSSVQILTDYDSRLVRIMISQGDRSPIRDIRFLGSKAFSASELNVRMTECLARDDGLSGYRADLFEYCDRNVLNFVRSRGYLQAEFSAPLRELSDKGLSLEVRVKEGPLYRLGDIVIEGANALSVDDVRSLLGTAKGEIADGEAIGKWLFEDLKKVYGRMGYIQYTSEPEPIFKSINDNRSEGIVDFRVTIEEGKRFTVGSIKFVGFDVPESALRQLFLVRKGDVFTYELFEQSIKRINDTNPSIFVDKDMDVEFITDEEVGSLGILVKRPKVESTRAHD